MTMNIVWKPSVNDHYGKIGRLRMPLRPSFKEGKREASRRPCFRFSNVYWRPTRMVQRTMRSRSQDQIFRSHSFKLCGFRSAGSRRCLLTRPMFPEFLRLIIGRIHGSERYCIYVRRLLV